MVSERGTVLGVYYIEPLGVRNDQGREETEVAFVGF